MSDILITMTDLQRDLDSLINQAAQSDDRVILFNGDEPTVVIMGIEACKRLGLPVLSSTYANQFDHALQKAAELRQKIQQWQQEHGIVAEDSVETLHTLQAFYE